MALSIAEIDQLRQDTPGTAHVLHANYAGASLISSQVFEAVQKYQAFELVQGGYETDVYYQDDLTQAHAEIASMLHADAAEIAITQSATHAWYLAFWSLGLRKGDVVLTSEVAYGSNFIGLLEGKHRLGIEINLIPATDDGTVDLQALEQMITPQVKLICLTHMPTNGGLVQPAEAVGEIAARHQVSYLLDACQSAGQYPLNVKALQCDFLCATGRKYMRAPRGTGFLYVKAENLDRLRPIFPDLRGAEWDAPTSFSYRAGAERFENFENSRAAQIGMGVATRMINEIGIDRIWESVQSRAKELRAYLSHIPRVQVWDRGIIKSGICTFTIEGMPASSVQQVLKSRKTNVSVSRKGSTLLDMEQRNLPELVRASVHYLTTLQEIEKLANQIDLIASGNS